MSSVNVVHALGRLTRDPELRYIPSGAAVCEFGLALNETYKGEESVTFLDVTCWQKTAEIAAKYLAKGRQVHITGRLQQDEWQDKATGQKRSKLKVVCDRLTLVGGPDDSGRDSSTRQRGPAAGGNQDGPSESDYPQDGGAPSDLGDDEVPF